MQWSWDLLSKDSHDALPKLTVFEGGFQLEAAEAVLGLDGEVWAFDVVQELVEASLLQVDAETYRFRLQPSVQQFAAARLGAAAREAVERRHSEHYSQLGTSDQLDLLDLADGQETLHRLDLELENTIAACECAVRLMETELAQRNLLAASRVLSRTGPLKRWLDLAQTVRAIAKEPRHIALVCLCQSNALAELRRIDDSIAVLTEAREYATLAKIPRLEDDIACNLAIAMSDLGKWDRSEQEWRRATEGYRAIGSKKGQARVLMNVAVDHMMLGDLERARALYHEALALAQDVGLVGLESVILDNLGSVYVAEKRWDEANEVLRRSLKIHEQRGERRSAGVVLATLGVAKAMQGDICGARELFEGTLEIAKALDEPLLRGATEVELGKLDGINGDWEAAYARALAAMQLLETASHAVELAKALAFVGVCEARLGRLQRANEIRVDVVAQMKDMNVGPQSDLGTCVQQLLDTLEEVQGPLK